MIKAGSFREDLFYRLNLIELVLPSLAERPDDILPLAEQFLDGGKTLHPLAQAALQSYSWPGNVRELKNKMTRASLLAQSAEITVQDLGLPQLSANHTEFGELELDRAMIESALKKAQGIISQAAAQLGLSRQALYRRMDRLGISRNG
jgi:DNA-binding NtrC family response regulator